MATVKLFANLRKAAGLKETTVMGVSVAEIVAGLVMQHPSLEAHLIENGSVRPSIIITINGHTTKDLQAPIQDQDEIAIFPPIAGG